MSGGRFTPGEGARRAGAKGGRANKRRLTLGEVEAAFGPLDGLEDVQRRLNKLATWATAGLLPGSVAGAAVRACEVWVRTHESRLTSETVDALRDRLDALEAQLKGRRTEEL